MIRAAVLLVGALAAYGWFLWGTRWPGRRPGTHRFVWAAWRMAAAFGVTGLAGVLLLGRGGALVTMPDEFAAARDVASAWTGMPVPLDLPVAELVGATFAGGLLAGLVARWRKRRPLTLGNVEAVMPRSQGELGWGMLLSVDAGVSEELFFRLLLPLLLAIVTGSAIAGFAVSATLFGFAHRYQGWVGMIATFLLALLLSAVYLLTGELWVAMLLHAALDVNAVVVRPVVAGTVGLFRSPPALRS